MKPEGSDWQSGRPDTRHPRCPKGGVPKGEGDGKGDGGGRRSRGVPLSQTPLPLDCLGGLWPSAYGQNYR